MNLSVCSQDDNTFSKANYNHRDGRFNFHELGNYEYKFVEKIKILSKSTACMIQARNLVPVGQTYQISDEVPTLAQSIFNRSHGIPLGEEEKFYHEKAAAEWTGFLLKKNQLLTAAHCICRDKSNTLLADSELNSMMIVFGFQMTDVDHCKTVFEKKDVYKIKSVVAHKWSRGKVYADWALLELDRDVEERAPLKLNFSNNISIGEEVFMFGYPIGLPLKFTGYATIQAIFDHSISTNLSAFGGNSGSPIFDKNGHVIAILTEGNRDFIPDNNYRNTGEIRIRTHFMSFNDTKKKGYEICQRISTLVSLKEKTSLFPVLKYLTIGAPILLATLSLLLPKAKKENEEKPSSITVLSEDW